MQELESIKADISEIERITNYLLGSGSQIYHKAQRQAKAKFKSSLLDIESSLQSLRMKLKLLPGSVSDPPMELIQNLVFEVDELHKNLGQISSDALEERIDLVQRIFATLRGALPMTLLEIEVDVPSILSKMPKTIKAEVQRDFEEVGRCYTAQAFRASIVFCGRIAETVLRRIYYEKRTGDGVPSQDVETQFEHWTLGVLIGKCREAGLLDNAPGMDEYSSLVNAVRIPSVHSTRKSFSQGPDAAKGVISLTVELVKSVY